MTEELLKAGIGNLVVGTKQMIPLRTPYVVTPLLAMMGWMAPLRQRCAKVGVARPP